MKSKPFLIFLFFFSNLGPLIAQDGTQVQGIHYSESETGDLTIYANTITGLDPAIGKVYFGIFLTDTSGKPITASWRSSPLMTVANAKIPVAIKEPVNPLFTSDVKREEAAIRKKELAEQAKRALAKNVPTNLPGVAFWTTYIREDWEKIYGKGNPVPQKMQGHFVVLSYGTTFTKDFAINELGKLTLFNAPFSIDRAGSVAKGTPQVAEVKLRVPKEGNYPLFIGNSFIFEAEATYKGPAKVIFVTILFEKKYSYYSSIFRERQEIVETVPAFTQSFPVNPNGQVTVAPVWRFSATDLRWYKEGVITDHSREESAPTYNFYLTVYADSVLCANKSGNLFLDPTKKVWRYTGKP